MEHETTMQEELPNIYDDHNHLEVSEYVDDIYQYYWVMEVQFHIPHKIFRFLVLCLKWVAFILLLALFFF